VASLNVKTMLDEDYQPVLSTRKCGCLHNIGWIAPSDSQMKNVVRSYGDDNRDNSRVRFQRCRIIVSSFQINFQVFVVYHLHIVYLFEINLKTTNSGKNLIVRSEKHETRKKKMT
jgi:hypothetical protein